MDTFYVGEEVVTRGGKRGTVLKAEGDSVTVAFGPGHSGFKMRVTQLVHGATYDAMGRRRANPNAYFLRGGR